MKINEQLAEIILEYSRPEHSFLPILYPVKFDIDRREVNTKIVTGITDFRIIEVFQ